MILSFKYKSLFHSKKLLKLIAIFKQKDKIVKHILNFIVTIFTRVHQNIYSLDYDVLCIALSVILLIYVFRILQPTHKNMML